MMKAEQLINFMIPPLKPSDQTDKAMQWLEEFRVTELPVIHKEKLLGYFHQDAVYNSPNSYDQVDKYPLKKPVFVPPWIHYYDVLRTLSCNEMEVIGVIDLNKYLGIVLNSDILKEFSATAIINSKGAIIIMETSISDYSLSEISRIVEMNDSMILGVNIKPAKNNASNIEILIRLQTMAIDSIKNGFLRSGYHVLATFNTKANSFDEKDRYDSLMKYIDL